VSRKKRNILVNKYELYPTEQTLRESNRPAPAGYSDPRRPTSSKEWVEKQNRELYGSCVACGKALKDGPWGTVNISEQACSEACAWNYYEAHAEEWDRADYGACAREDCGKTIRHGDRWYIEIKQGKSSTKLWTCSEECGWWSYESLCDFYGVAPDPDGGNPRREP
jgi:hypothetical protein